MLSTLIAFFLATVAPIQTHESEVKMRKEIHAEELKSMYDQNQAMTIVDARSKPYFDGTLLPQAKWVSAESSESEIEAAIPSKESAIVVYCAGVDCPASGWLYDKLVTMGYTNVSEYPEGLKDWMQRGLPTSTQ